MTRNPGRYTHGHHGSVLRSHGNRNGWSGTWADRILQSRIAGQLLQEERATRPELTAIANARRRWAAAPDGWLAVLHGEILCRTP